MPDTKGGLDVGPFLGSDEKWLVWVPLLLFLPLIALELFAWGRVLDLSKHEVFLQYLADVLMLNIVHVAWSFVLLGFLPEMKEWVSLKTSGRPWRLWAALALLWAFFFGMLYRSGILFGPKMSSGSATYLLALTIFLGLTLLHGINQIRGLSIVYNHTIRQRFAHTEMELKRSLAAERKERAGFRVLSLAVILQAISFSAGSFLFPSFWAAHGKDLSWAFLTLTLACVAWILLQCWSSPYTRQTNKLPYLLRAAFYPFGGISLFARLAANSVHGTEYLGVFRKMARTSRMEERKLKRLYFISLFVTALWIVLITPRYWGGHVAHPYYHPDFASVPRWIYLFVSATVALDLTHFVLERYLYKMRDPITRETVGTLLALGRTS